MIINGSNFLTIPDTGSRENMISLDELRRLGPRISGKPQEFVMGNGGKTRSLGSVYLKCAFAKGDQLPTRRLFHVFNKLVVKAIMGKKFLDDTETLKKHQHRLEEVYTTTKTSLLVMHLSRPRQLMFCYVNGHLVQANLILG